MLPDFSQWSLFLSMVPLGEYKLPSSNVSQLTSFMMSPVYWKPVVYVICHPSTNVQLVEEEMFPLPPLMPSVDHSMAV